MKYYTLEYTHDESGVQVTAAPSHSTEIKGNEYFKKEICYISFNTECVSFRQNFITLEMLQEIMHNLHELTEQHKKYLTQKSEYSAF